MGQTNLDETRRQVVSISQDSFYRELNAAEKIKASKGQFNFDHPGIPIKKYIMYMYSKTSLIAVSRKQNRKKYFK